MVPAELGGVGATAAGAVIRLTLARQEVAEAKDALRTRNIELAQDLVRQDAEINRLNRSIFKRAVEIGDDLELRPPRLPPAPVAELARGRGG